MKVGLSLDKRVSPRFHVRPEERALYAGGAWRIRDLSVGGAFLEDPDPLPVGRTLYLELHLGKERLPCNGVVRRSIPREGMGLQFQNLSLKTKNRLERYLNSLAKSPPEIRWPQA